MMAFPPTSYTAPPPSLPTARHHWPIHKGQLQQIQTLLNSGFIDQGIFELTWFTHFCRDFSFVVITRFLGGTFGPQN